MLRLVEYTCPDCDGSGWYRGDREVDCRICHGSGRVTTVVNTDDLDPENEVYREGEDT